MTDCVRILLIDDDQEDFLIVADMLAAAANTKFRLDWARAYEEGLETIFKREHDVYLLDYLMGSHNGLDIMEKAIKGGCKAPIIFLTAHGNYEVDLKAMETGASDYLVKGEFTAHILERAIRYSITSKRIEEELKLHKSSLEELVRQRTEEIMAARDNLELHVQQRTLELAKTLKELEKSRGELKLLASQLLRAQEEERKRIAREIHDSIGSSLSAVKFCLEHMMAQFDKKDEMRQAFSTLSAAMVQAIDDSRRIMTDLRPSILDDLGVIATIGWFCRGFESIYTDIPVERRIELEESQVPENLKIIIFRIIQEAMNNSAKHSRAERIFLDLSVEDRCLLLRIGDNGVGFDGSTVVSKGECAKFGLTSMRERAELSGGCFDIESKPGVGTTIKVCWRI